LRREQLDVTVEYIQLSFRASVQARFSRVVAEQALNKTGTSSIRKVATFGLNQAILTALQRNPNLLPAEQEIQRTKGIVLEIREQALPHITATAESSD
jgi:outer membrane protein TolC